MELTITTIILAIILIFIFRSSLRKVNNTIERIVDHGNNIAITNIVENTVELNGRMQNALQVLEEQGGALNFEEAYRKALGQSK